MSKRLALVGTAPSSRLLAPFADASVDIWACSPDNSEAGSTLPPLPRVTRFFEVHGDLGLPGMAEWEPGYIAWLNGNVAAGQFALVTQDHRLFPESFILPKEKLVDSFGAFFTSTPAWMLGLALMEGFTEIGLFGLDMSTREEYRFQRPGFHHLIWCAQRLHNVTIYAPRESDVLQPLPMYGFDLSDPMGRKLEVHRQELLARVSDLDRRSGQMQRERDMLAGALDNIDYMQSIWAGHLGEELASGLRPAANVVNFKTGD